MNADWQGLQNKELSQHAVTKFPLTRLYTQNMCSEAYIVRTDNTAPFS